MTQAPRLLAILLVAVSVAPALADDGFTTIHQDNQKIGSPVSEFWARLHGKPAPPAVDGFIDIYMANQKIGSPVANLWQLLSKSDCSVLTVALSPR